MDHGLASTPAVAYEMMRRMGPQQALADPSTFDARMGKLAQQLKSTSPVGGIQNLVMGAMEMSGKTGMPLEQAVAHYARSAQRQQAWEQSGAFKERMGDLTSLEQAKEQAEGQGASQADTMKAVTAFTMGTGRGRQMLLDFQKNPTPELAHQLFSAARNDPKSWTEREIYNPSQLLSHFSPQQREALDYGEQTFNASTLMHSKSVTQALQNPERYKDFFIDPSRMSQQTSQWFSPLSRQEKDQLMNPAVRGMVLDHLSAPMVDKQPKPDPWVKPYVPVGKVQPEEYNSTPAYVDPNLKPVAPLPQTGANARPVTPS
jgi:hypothetical protein